MIGGQEGKKDDDSKTAPRRKRLAGAVRRGKTVTALKI